MPIVYTFTALHLAWMAGLLALVAGFLGFLAGMFYADRWWSRQQLGRTPRLPTSFEKHLNRGSRQ